MPVETIKLQIVLIMAFGFGFASLLGYLAIRIGATPILGYLIAGYLIGPYSPGYVADTALADQLAEIGVVLMMFGVGLHFKLNDLMKVKHIAIPGAIIQTFLTALFTVTILHYMGWNLQYALIFGLGIGVASTVLLVRVLTDNNLVQTKVGHIAIGWLIVEDIITVFVLLLIPSFEASLNGAQVSLPEILHSMFIAVVKFFVLGILVFTIGKKVIEIIIHKIISTKSHELFTLTVLAITFLIAVGASMLFGTSIALGAFMAGMVMGQSEAHKRISNISLPLKDTFVVIFFLAVGMIFNPRVLYDNYVVFFCILLVILIFKPLVAFLISLAYKQTVNASLVIAIGLAQIGEFSFILAEEATRFHVLPDEGFDLIVACALVSIIINPSLFKLIKTPKELPGT